MQKYNLAKIKPRNGCNKLKCGLCNVWQFQRVSLACSPTIKGLKATT